MILTHVSRECTVGTQFKSLSVSYVISYILQLVSVLFSIYAKCLL